MFLFLIRFLFFLLALRLVVDIWRRLTGRRPESTARGPSQRARGGAGPGGVRAEPGTQGPVQGRPESHGRMRATLDRDHAVDVPFVEVGAPESERAGTPHGADRG